MRSNRKYKLGVSAVEFALVFPVLFVIIYGLLTYSLIFALQHSMSLAAAEGGRAAIRYQTNSDEFSARKNAACLQIKKTLYWLERLGINTDCSSGYGGKLLIKAEKSNCPISSANSALACIVISLEYNYEQFPILPKIPFILPTPRYLLASSLTQFTLTY